MTIVLYSQPLCNIQHYSNKNGLSENTVMSIIQDRTGYMWFGTWDGLCKFDGFSFTNYKVKPGDPVRMSNSRIDKIVEDSDGFIWILLYGKDVCRFDPATETFVNIPPLNSQYQGSWAPVANIACLKSGAVWLLSDNEGALRIEKNSNDKKVNFKEFNKKNGLLESNTIYQVKEDNDGNEWILTDNGLFLYKQGQEKPQPYFFETEPDNIETRQSFQAYLELDNVIWFGSSKGRLWQYQKKGGKYKLLNVPTKSNIQSIYQLNDSCFFIATFSDGFFVFNKNNSLFSHYNSQSNLPLPGNIILNTYMSKNGDVWIQQDYMGITQFLSSRNKIRTHLISNENTNTSFEKPEFFILEDINDNLWVHPYGGGFSFYNKNTEKLMPFYNDKTSSRVLFSKYLHSLYSDRQGNLWMCTRTKGIEKVTFTSNKFHLIQPIINANSFLSNDIRSGLIDEFNRIWIGTKEGKIIVFDHNLSKIGYLTQDGRIANSGRAFDGAAYCMAKDDNGKIWIGTKGDGLYELTPIMYNSNNNSFNIKNFRYENDNLYSLSNNSVYHLYIDSKKRLWIATFGGGLNLLSQKNDGSDFFYNHRNNLNSYPNNSCYRARYITADYNNNIWVATTNGIITFSDDFVEPESISFNHITYQQNDSNCLSNNDIHYIHVTKNRDIYLATFGGGLNKLIASDNNHSFRFKHYNMNSGLPSDVLLTINEDSKGFLWISTENGLSRFDQDHEIFDNYSEVDFGFPISFSEAVTINDRNDAIYFGTSTGLLKMYPDSIQKSSFVPPIVFTELKLFNKTVVANPDNSILKNNINHVDNIVLNHNQNIFSIGFAALDMKNPEAVQFAYMLDGLENEWNYVSNKQIASYTNLSAGNYVFKVKSTNGDGRWVNNIRELPITVLPSFWATPWAMFLYFIVALILIFATVYILFTIYRLRHKVQVESQLANIKLNFFTDISHELRTPLTLITGPVENVLQNSTLSPDIREQLIIVGNNTNRMLRLINQILDFVKLQNNKMKLHIENVEMVQFLNQIMDYFKFYAIEKDIKFEFQNPSTPVYIWADRDKLEKIVFNLLSNAFKYIQTGKTITLFLSETDQNINITVKDTGIGINEKKATDLFKRFENIWSGNSIEQPSTGIGLSIVKELITMHHGTIEVESQEGIGSSFILTFKKGLTHFPDDVEIIVNDNSETELENYESKSDFSFDKLNFNIDKHNQQPIILVVEDNDDVRSFICKLLDKKYNIIQAPDGEKGLRMAQEYLPDLIISDLMMPVMNGVQFLESVRSDFNISHTPFVILSAKTAIEAQVEGFEKGADAYITKPFSTAYLLTRVDNLLNKTQQLQSRANDQKYSDKFELEPSKIEITSHDNQFLQAIMSIMEKNMDNGDLVVENFVDEMAVSRSVFFKKLKSLTGLAPVEFIREMRLKRAVQLIEESEYNLSQIAYMVGINTPRYFSKCFKQKYGVTPTKYRENYLANNN
ncbi:MAG: response regulator [Marinilabiliaceae bacterium]|nr:response regulator [Marinilabiliaceae bacterium]